MDILVHYQPSLARDNVFIHAWEKGGKVWDFLGEQNPDGSFVFRIKGVNLPDLREFSFKYRFLGTQWESDDYTRQLPTTNSQEVWTFDFTPRCLTHPPGAATTASHLTFNVITQSKYVGGTLYLWQPNSTNQYVQPQTSRDDAGKISRFVVPVQDWMRQGFHFKLKSAVGTYEPESVNRIWRPSDGQEMYLKAGQLDIRPQPIQLVTETIELIYPASLATVPLLNLQDISDDHQASFPATESAGIATDSLFRTARYSCQVYRGATYSLDFNLPGSAGDPPRPFRLRLEDSPGTTKALYGNRPWLKAVPSRTAQVQLVIHPNPQSRFGSQIPLQVGVGQAPAHQILTAQQKPDGTWQAQLQLFPELLQWIALVPANELTEAWLGIPLSSPRRQFTPAHGGPIVYHTLDGIGGLALQPPTLQDLAPVQRQQLMASAFSQAIIDAGVFDTWEMPHGCVKHQGQAWFTLCAPHAVTATVLILDPASPESGPRLLREYPMTLTSDLRYWWCAIPEVEASHGTLYRFQLNNLQEVLDPASRWVSDAESLNARPNEGREGSWSRVVDRDALNIHFQDSHWQTIGWEALLIYELHAKRFTNRNPGASSSFDQLAHELTASGYLNRLPVSALELLPLHEFPKDNSWGYNPSLFFAIESSYGGPQEFARLVRASHDAGKAVLLDIVYNHFSDSPLQSVARDLYADGETTWGDMVNYDHPIAIEFFRQALIYVWLAFGLDGFRFDATEAIVNGGRDDLTSSPYILARGQDGRLRNGSGGGWEFLDALLNAIRKAANAVGQPWPYLVGENDPNNWPMSARSGVLDGQWHFGHHYPLADAARNKEDKASDIRDQMNWPHIQLRPYHEAVRYAESHDSVSGQENSKQRIARRESFGYGRRMAKAIGTAAILAKGVPMLFMGEEAGEDKPFYFGLETYLPLHDYEDLGNEMSRIYAWFRDIMGLRNNPNNNIRGDDDQSVGIGNKTIAFTRGWGRFFIICTFGTPDTQQDSGWLGLPSSRPFKEIFNSSWPAYQVNGETEATNDGYRAQIYSGNMIRLPYIGSVILERR